ncbi:siderophore ABC transporter substrate-binding protein [Peribacillus loiseleuriae]|uniref:siderophore ABC transporter substrate-binding protein n=1 Tax=Peribacillus loiseleuriae TaxID=1679170 RepID=UPI0038174C15
MKKIYVTLLISMLAIFIVACGSDKPETSKTNANEDVTQEDVKQEEVKSESKEITVKHLLGETTVKTLPEKVAVFDMGSLDTLDKLGVESVVAVPHDGLPTYLNKYEGTTENAGGLKEPDFEKLAAVAPDLIIISGRQAESYEELSKIAPTIYMGVDTSKYMESFEQNVTTLGEIFGKEDEAVKELGNVEKSIEELKTTVNPEKTGLILLSNGGKVSAFGPNSRFGIIHDVFGVKAVDDKLEVSTHGNSINFEYIVEKNPDYLFVVDRDAVAGDGAAAKTTIENDLVKGTKAFKEGNIVYLDPSYWYLSGGGLESVQEMVHEISEGLK